MNEKLGRHSGTRGPLRILCADDNAVLGRLMLHLFTDAGDLAEFVSNGLEAWDRLSKDIEHFDVLVTDHQMPGLDGLELVELLRQARYPGRIVVHTSGLSNEDAETYRQFGVDSILTKSSRMEELMNTVRRFVGR